MWNGAAVCVGIMGLKMFARDLSEKWKSLERKSAMIFSVTLMYSEYMETSLLMRVHPKHQDNVSWRYSLTGHNEDLCIHTKSLKRSANSRL